MASLFFVPISVFHYTSNHGTSKRLHICKPICSSQSTSKAINAAVTPVRRSANYEPSLWSFDQVQSLSSKFTEENYGKGAYSLKEEVKTMIYETSEVGNPLKTLEVVDDLQRLGISYHFEDEIRHVMEKIYNDHYKTHDKWNTMDLNLKSLGFRLLRQHGYQVPQEIFYNFEEKTQTLKPHIYEDMLGMLNLYEATYHSFEGESILDDARYFTTNYFQENLENINGSILPLVSHALVLPLHWRVLRVEAMWYIEVYEKRSDMNTKVMELAKLDFNMVQAVYLEDLKHSARWWQKTKWDKKLSFARDRLLQCVLWTIGANYLPHFSRLRRIITKVTALVTTIDDVYDVYGTLDELEQFTNVIKRWDINATDELPDYMRICFLGFFNTINEFTYDTLTDTDFLILPYLKKAWADFCKSHLTEAQWYHNGHTPTLEEYLDNASVSIGAPVSLMHFNFLTSVTSKDEILRCMERSYNIVRNSSLIVRLADDLGTSSDEMARGDNPKSIQCYMKESGVDEDEARVYIKTLMMKAWKKLNEERARADSQFAREYIEGATNMARIAQFIYGDGDGHGRPDITKRIILSLLFNPIQGV